MELKRCNLEIAKKLKSINIDITRDGWDSENPPDEIPGDRGFLARINSYELPTLALVQMWFDKKHDIDIHITRGAYSYPIPSNMNRKKKFMTVLYSPLYERGLQLKGVKATYDQALEVGILESIKLIENGSN